MYYVKFVLVYVAIASPLVWYEGTAQSQRLNLEVLPAIGVLPSRVTQIWASRSASCSHWQKLRGWHCKHWQPRHRFHRLIPFLNDALLLIYNDYLHDIMMLDLVINCRFIPSRSMFMLPCTIRHNFLIKHITWHISILVIAESEGVLPSASMLSYAYTGRRSRAWSSSRMSCVQNVCSPTIPPQNAVASYHLLYL